MLSAVVAELCEVFNLVDVGMGVYAENVLVVDLKFDAGEQ